MKEYTFYLTVMIKVVSAEKSLETAMEEFQQETDYTFGDTELSRIVKTEILEAKPNYK